MEEIKVEVWKDIKGYERKYQISNYGRVKSLERLTNAGIKNNRITKRKEKILKPLKVTKGYYSIRLYDENKQGKTLKIHRLVAEAFIPNTDKKEQVNHIDGNKANNRVDNLEWCNCKENMEHSYKIGLRDKEYLREHMREIGKTGEGAKTRWNR